MKAKVLIRINVLLAMLLSVLGFHSCENQGEVLVKYGIQPDTTVYPMYGVPVPEYGVEMPPMITDEDEQNIND